MKNIFSPEDHASSRDSVTEMLMSTSMKVQKNQIVREGRCLKYRFLVPSPEILFPLVPRNLHFSKPLPKSNLDRSGSQSRLCETLVQHFIWHQNPRWDSWPGSKESGSGHSKKISSVSSCPGLFLLFSVVGWNKLPSLSQYLSSKVFSSESQKPHASSFQLTLLPLAFSWEWILRHSTQFSFRAKVSSPTLSHPYIPPRCWGYSRWRLSAESLSKTYP